MYSINDIDSYLIREVPEFSEIYNEHSDCFGKILHHVLFGDLTRFLIENFRHAKEENKPNDLFLRIMDFVETIYADGDEGVRQLVEASFLENLHQAGDDYERIKEYLGEKTATKLLAMESWKP
jgi:hypothetical protein